MRDRIVDEISVCADCMIAHANGETGERPADLPPVWGLIRFGYSVTMGGEHNEGCPNGIGGLLPGGRRHPQDPRDTTECDCGDLGFTWTSCEGCGDSHGGDRFKFTLWRATDSTARQEYRAAIARAHDANRRQTHPMVSLRALDDAAAWHGFIRDRLAEDKANAAWMARHATAVANGFN